MVAKPECWEAVFVACAQVMPGQLEDTLVLQGRKQSRHVAQLKVIYVLAFIVLNQEFDVTGMKIPYFHTLSATQQDV